MDKYRMWHHMVEIDNGSGEKYCKDLRELVAFCYTSDPKAPLNYKFCKMRNNYLTYDNVLDIFSLLLLVVLQSKI